MRGLGDDRPEAERTWANMQSDFRDWHDKKMANTTTEAAGHHGANLASSASDDPFLSRADLLLADTTEALKTNQAMMANLAKKSNEKDDAIAKLRQETASVGAARGEQLRHRQGSRRCCHCCPFGP